MELTFVPAVKQVAQREEIILNCRKIGVIFPYVGYNNDNKFQVQLHLSNCMNPGGFGYTKEEAIKDALKNAAEMVATFAAEVSELRSEMELP